MLKAKYLVFCVLIGIFCLLAYFIHGIFSGIEQQKTILKNIQTLPQFTAQKIDGSVFKSSQTQGNKPLLIVFFHPDCEHCQYQAEALAKHQADFKNIEIVMISFSEKSNIKSFSEKYHLTNFVLLLQMEAKDIAANFGSINIPQSFIYDKNHHFVKQYKGETKIELLLKSLP